MDELPLRIKKDFVPLTCTIPTKMLQVLECKEQRKKRTLRAENL